MHTRATRVWLVFGLGLLAVPLVGAALAYGCTALATLQANPGAAAAGATVKVDGQGFGTHDAATGVGANGPAEIRLGSVNGPVLAKASPSGPDRRFSTQITVPEGFPPGDTILIATQKDAAGRPVYGTPARQAFTVVAPSPAPAPGVTPSPGAGTPPAGTPPATGPNRSQRIKRRLALRKAIARCKTKYSARRAKRATGKRRMAKRRAACIRKARAKHRS